MEGSGGLIKYVNNRYMEITSHSRNNLRIEQVRIISMEHREDRRKLLQNQIKLFLHALPKHMGHSLISQHRYIWNEMGEDE